MGSVDVRCEYDGKQLKKGRGKGNLDGGNEARRVKPM